VSIKSEKQPSVLVREAPVSTESDVFEIGSGSSSSRISPYA
jgi:hypothetical protein